MPGKLAKSVPYKWHLSGHYFDESPNIFVRFGPSMVLIRDFFLRPELSTLHDE